MDLIEQDVGGVTVLAVKGRVDSTNSADFSSKLGALYATPGRRLLLDLQQLEYISSAGFRALLIAARHASQSGGKLALCGLSGKLRDLFDLGGFLDNFLIQSSREEGISKLA